MVSARRCGARGRARAHERCEVAQVADVRWQLPGDPVRAGARQASRASAASQEGAAVTAALTARPTDSRHGTPEKWRSASIHLTERKKHNTPPLRIPVAETVLVPPGAMSPSLLARRDHKEPSHWAGGPTCAYPSPGSSSACTAVSSPIAGARPPTRCGGLPAGSSCSAVTRQRLRHPPMHYVLMFVMSK